MFIDFTTADNCRNPWAYEICVKCNACGRINKDSMLQDRLKVLEEYLQERKSFDRWSDDKEIRKIQEQNLRTQIKELEEEIEKIKKQLAKGKQG
ncbi:hypothetical protein Calhy_0425 [Caldicellulosiruptor hydrothermalis 108]|uniref:Uncharacterized protein n=1 Tax=Caldicellulosiruptor hydrothermalis (strain DSM 18901 / VKM B-2411 / 108) TaxID=632292 RepID=E4QBZ8_CALH1|nr:hypothetical protein [Caldicellulosiruptor hydrothermalis]ADQ06172.1 hypothetical protein Calhy_0425 [Caldicellulosiruptor hydrothermalis 108]